MNKLYLYIFCIATLISCSTYNEPNSKLRYITLDTSVKIEQEDISQMLSGDVEIIALESNPESIVGLVDEVICNENYYLIVNQHHIAIFDLEGTFIRNIGAMGRARNEYIKMGAVALSKDSLYVQCEYNHKVLVYPIDGSNARVIDLNKDLYYSDIFVDNDNVCFITNYSSDFNLITTDRNGKTINKQLPYDKSITRNNSTWGLENYSSKYRDTTLLIFSRCDTIYSHCKGDISPSYVVNFPVDKIPDAWLKKSGVEIFKSSINDNYILGLSEVHNVKDYIVGKFGKGVNFYEFIYTKESGATTITNSTFVLNDFGKLPLLNLSVTDDNGIIALYDAALLKSVWNNIINKNSFRNQNNRDKFKSVVDRLEDTDNPVLLKFKFRQSVKNKAGNNFDF